jgi:23S rRNA pseudouridine1911/1915/1917 synthase
VALRFIVEQVAPDERVDKWLATRIADTSRAKIQVWIREGRVHIDGRACRPKDTLYEGAIVEVEPGTPAFSQAEPDATIELEILYEDEHLLVVNKPAGLVVHPAKGHAAGTLVNGLLALGSFERFPIDERDPTGYLRPGIVHRIDKDTSGLLVVTKTDAAREGLKTALAEHSVERVYAGITCGVPRISEIRTHYGRHPTSRLRFTSNLQEGKLAVTHVRVIESLAAGHAALVECKLETGRTHQIRVHLTERAKTPLLADTLYRTHRSSDVVVKPAAEAIGHQALHAGVLGFEHPITKQFHRFEVAPPSEFLTALEVLRSAGEGV